MAIKTIKEPDIYLTEGEHRRLLDEYHKSHMFYSGPMPTFEEWVRSRREFREQIKGTA